MSHPAQAPRLCDHAAELAPSARRYLEMRPMGKYLRPNTLGIEIDYHLPMPSAYAIVEVTIGQLFIGCAGTAGRCFAGQRVGLLASPHYAFVTGDVDAYAEYYADGFKRSSLVDDHTVEAHRANSNPNTLTLEP